jgi:hypothetical protein
MVASGLMAKFLVLQLHMNLQNRQKFRGLAGCILKMIQQHNLTLSLSHCVEKDTYSDYHTLNFQSFEFTGTSAMYDVKEFLLQVRIEFGPFTGL